MTAYMLEQQLKQQFKHKFTVHQYHQIAETGIFSSSDRVELIDGEIIKMSPVGRKHAACVARLNALFQGKFIGQALVWVQNPIRLNDDSEPQPDLALLLPRQDFYESDLPTAKDILLVVEVSDSTIAYDRTVKSSIYAEAGISEMWLLDLNEQAIEAYSQPSTRSYKRMQRYEQNDTFSILAFPDLNFVWTDMFANSFDRPNV
ncbi:Putative restriction endonuclease domain-containing protein [Tumidithrix helvetica PCC 7403]|uniref:Uma2 family endonuclease n=1 Tax=Tumidithrix helvetica TaxID=3457545 RepID=UPI003C8C9D21